MNQDGTATVLSGAVEIGQGYGSIICQIVAEALGIRYDDVNAITADTGAAPVAIGNVASSGTSSPANACKLAAEDVRRKLFALAAPRLDTSPDNLEARDRAIWIKAVIKRSQSRISASPTGRSWGSGEPTIPCHQGPGDRQDHTRFCRSCHNS